MIIDRFMFRTEIRKLKDILISCHFDQETLQQKIFTPLAPLWLTWGLTPSEQNPTCNKWDSIVVQLDLTLAMSFGAKAITIEGKNFKFSGHFDS